MMVDNRWRNMKFSSWFSPDEDRGRGIAGVCRLIPPAPHDFGLGAGRFADALRCGFA
jgi:hypothetical protein